MPMLRDTFNNVTRGTSHGMHTRSVSNRPEKHDSILHVLCGSFRTQSEQTPHPFPISERCCVGIPTAVGTSMLPSFAHVSPCNS